MYKQCYDGANKVIANSVIRTVDGACIPFDPDNTDYAEFKKAVTAGAELQDADGVKMTAKAAKAFIATLP
jgi:hypothetical protein